MANPPRAHLPEAPADAGKHAAASRAGTTLSHMDDVVVLDVRDDGAGFPAERVLADGHAGDGHGYGPTSMRRRLTRVAGGLGVRSAPGDGTTVTATAKRLFVSEATNCAC
jgi:signal transduction histidine kinase